MALVRSARLDEKRQDDMLRPGDRVADDATAPRARPGLRRAPPDRANLSARPEKSRGGGFRRPHADLARLCFRPTWIHQSIVRQLVCWRSLTSPRPSRPILDHQARSSDLKAQIHDAYCLRAMKQGWTPESKAAALGVVPGRQRLGRGLQLPGLSRHDDPGPGRACSILREQDRYLARRRQFPFPTRVLVQAIDLDSNPALGAGPGFALRSTSLEPRGREWSADLRDRDRGKAGEHAAGRCPRGLARSYTVVMPSVASGSCRRSASHPTEEDLPILVAGLDSRDSTTTSRCSPDCTGSRPSRQARTVWPSCSGWHGGVGPRMSAMLNSLAVAVDRRCRPRGRERLRSSARGVGGGLSPTVSRRPVNRRRRNPPAKNSYSLDLLIKNVLAFRRDEDSLEPARPEGHRAGQVPRLPQVRLEGRRRSGPT